MSEEQFFKILLIGDCGVGKSSVMVRFTEDSFTESYISTIGVDFKVRTVETNNKPIKLQIWDTAGQERFRTITRNYYKGAQGILMVYDVTNMQSFENVKNWSKEVENYSDLNLVKFLIGNKCDLEDERAVTKKMGEELGKSLGLRFFESSAKTNDNIEEIFTELAKDIDDKGFNVNPQNKKVKINTTKKGEGGKLMCCH
ncbi:ras and ef-hand domain-containing protein [Anaeramoeba flamelloides]|uniref:Ras-related protein Rab-1 n=1 Tax=Anaeramoeba flamelloides TaxID=1746091 RepID=A0AAV8A742_9EUKA|nr:ras and ef-hand domain-containing protein [Anaeramoeba flamelloides]KAJ6246313.1 ras and ef-hand domain-containing protein [Anaeramoeba flamelloides]|eukprot:Anaeramoba_flamelloidesa89245_46.p1 GENE.a89245_46~~a89245_46.p1  ORF type:complete len:199 (-),score=49.99 a89245_46:67-663(-)